GIAKPPKTFEQFLSAVDSLKRVGVPGLVSGWGESWLVYCFATNYAFNILGEDKMMATFKGDVPYTDPDWVEVFSVFQTLSERGALIEGIVTKPNKFAEQDFALERAAFAFNGSWFVNVYPDMNPDLDFGVMLPPPISDKYPMRIWGGAGSSFVVNDQSSMKEEAVDFLKWMTAEKQQIFLAAETRNLPANRKAIASIPEILSDFVSVMDQTTHPSIWEFNEDARIVEKFTKGIQSIIIGEKTPQQVAQEVNQAKEKLMRSGHL
ncbi:MAG: extracellular solute-binding protein, partial [Candidatus Omnitrophica bacterium]|nr:extracellular solute-binding protein [Candidatus Omnitrophota bacterium]